MTRQPTTTSCSPLPSRCRTSATPSSRALVDRPRARATRCARPSLRPADIDGFCLLQLHARQRHRRRPHAAFRPVRCAISTTSRWAAPPASSRSAAPRARSRRATRTSSPASPATPTRPTLSAACSSAFSRFRPDAAYPYGAGGPNMSFALAHRRLHAGIRRDAGGFRPHLHRPAAERAGVSARADEAPAHDGAISRGAPDRRSRRAVRLRDALRRRRSVPRHARSHARAVLGIPFVQLRATIERHNAFAADPIQLRGGWAIDRDELYAMAGATPDGIDFVADLRRLSRHRDDAVRGSRVLRQGRGDRLRPRARPHDGRRLSPQHLRRPALGRTGGRGGRAISASTEAIRQLTGAALGAQVANAQARRSSPGSA